MCENGLAGLVTDDGRSCPDGRWLVTQGDRQFSATDLAELKELAKSGKVGPATWSSPRGDRLALRLGAPRAEGLLRRSRRPYNDDAQPESGSGATLAIMGILAVLIVIAAGVFYHYATTIPGRTISISSARTRAAST
jgi:hypothetical protein